MEEEKERETKVKAKAKAKVGLMAKGVVRRRSTSVGMQGSSSVVWESGGHSGGHTGGHSGGHSGGGKKREVVGPGAV